MKFTREQLRAKGYAPDGKGGLIRLPEEEWYAKHVPQEPKPKTMTKAEERWLDVLEHRHSGAIIIPQFRIRCSEWNAVSPTHYTADFAIWHCLLDDMPESFICKLWEVKDKRRKPHSDELVRAKIARKSNPWISAVFLAEWDGEQWNERRLA